MKQPELWDIIFREPCDACFKEALFPMSELFVKSDIHHKKIKLAFDRTHMGYEFQFETAFENIQKEEQRPGDPIV